MAFLYYSIVLLAIVPSISSSRIQRDALTSNHPYIQAVLGILPSDVKAQVLKIAADNNISQQEKFEKIHALMISLPQSIRDKIPLPPALKKLPQPIQNKIMGIVKNGSLSLSQKRDELDDVYNNLTPEQKKLVPLWTKIRANLGA